MKRLIFTLLWVSVTALPVAAAANKLEDFSQEFWAWRAVEQPFTTDDIPRIERPANFTIDWSAATVAKRRAELTQFETRWKALAPPSDRPVAEKVDYRLLGSALARVRWEFDIAQGWKRNPLFYVDQTLGSVYALLLPPPPFDAARQKQLISRMDSVGQTLEAARTNLTDMRAPFVRLAIDSLADLPGRTDTMVRFLSPYLSQDTVIALKPATETAVKALNGYRAWLQSQLSSAKAETAIGRDNYLLFLRDVALMPFTPEQLLAMSRQEWSRTVTFEALEQNRNAGVPPVPLFADQQAQMTREENDERRVRDFLVRQKLLTVPDWMRHYRNLPLPAYVAPFADLGVTDDLTSASRLDENGTSYIDKPAPDLGFFALSTAHDPRPILVHEGVPGHYFQLTLSWANPDPIRRRYYDSGANEGIGFYAEEMMLQAGFFDDSPHIRETIYSFMRLRALRVEVDVKLALGLFTLEQAADYLTKTVPMDHATALEEAALFASTPGQAISYQIGKIQIMNLLADARRAQGKDFSLLKFDDFVWSNGNVPLSLQRWQMLGDNSDVPSSE